MNKLMISALTFAAIATTPAYAINANYRAQLERSGCTEMNAGTTCDIHKTKTQNKANTPTVDVTPYLGKWAVKTESGQELPDLDVRKQAFIYGGDQVNLSAEPIIADGALYITVNKMSFTLKKNGEGRWVSPEGMGTLLRK